MIGVIHSDSHHILAFFQIRRDVIFEAGIAIGTETHLLAIHIDGRVHIYTVELEEKHFVLQPSHLKLFPVPSDASGQRSPTRSAGVADVEVTLASPVVRHVKATPMGVIIVYLGHLR